MLWMLCMFWCLCLITGLAPGWLTVCLHAIGGLTLSPRDHWTMLNCNGEIILEYQIEKNPNYQQEPPTNHHSV